jgi:ribosome-associated protein
MLGVMNGELRLNDRVVIPAAELTERFSRSSGPGGQGVNTTDSRVELSFDVQRSPSLPGYLRERALQRLAGRLSDGVLTLTASEHRAQLQNRAAARARMTALLSDAIAPPGPARRATKPSRGSVERRIESKKRRGNIKQGRRGQW